MEFDKETSSVYPACLEVFSDKSWSISKNDDVLISGKNLKELKKYIKNRVKK